MSGRDLVSMGAYVPGSDGDLDAALKAWPKIQGFLQQEVDANFAIPDTIEFLNGVIRQ
jgi:flagellum-specific ATP synthase